MSVLEGLKQQRFLPMYCHDDADVVWPLLQACHKAGVNYFEFTNRTPNAVEVFHELKKRSLKELPDFKLGIGTIKTLADAELFWATNPDFMVSPLISVELIDFTQRRQVSWIPGCSTPTEIGLAERAGIPLVKLFPANLLGGHAFVRTMKDVFPSLHWMVSGGMRAERAEVQGWLDAGAHVVGLGSQLMGKTPDAASLTQRLNDLMA